MSNNTSWGSLFAAMGAVTGSVAPFIPPQYAIFSSVLSALFGAVAVKLP